MTKVADVAVKDLNFIYEWIKKNHPAPAEIKCSHPVFRRWFDKGFKMAMNKTKRIRTKAEYKQVLNDYVNGFKDRHLRLEPPNRKIGNNRLKKDIANIDFQEKDLCWVTLKSFYPRNKEQLHQLREVVDNIKYCRRKDIIVLDFRGAEGGNTVWGVNMLNNLFTKRYIDSLENYPYRNFSLVFRVSKDNINNLEEDIKNKLKEIQTRKYYRKILMEMKKAIKNNKNLVRIFFKTKYKKTREMSNPVRGRIYVLTEGGRSAVLLILDRLLSIKGVMQVGRPTGSDTLYGECGEVKLPSGNFNLIYPTAIRDYIIRKNNENYIPKYSYMRDIYNTPKVKNWIIKLNKKLARKHK